MIHLVNNFLLSLSLKILTRKQYRILMHIIMDTSDGCDKDAINYLTACTKGEHKRYYTNNDTNDNIFFFHLQLNNQHFVHTPCSLSYPQAHGVCEFLRLNSKEALKEL